MLNELPSFFFFLIGLLSHPFFSYSGMLPEAVLPPSDEHSYAQWLERDHFDAQGRVELLIMSVVKSQ